MYQIWTNFTTARQISLNITKSHHISLNHSKSQHISLILTKSQHISPKLNVRVWRLHVGQYYGDGMCFLYYLDDDAVDVFIWSPIENIMQQTCINIIYAGDWRDFDVFLLSSSPKEEAAIVTSYMCISITTSLKHAPRALLVHTSIPELAN